MFKTGVAFPEYIVRDKRNRRPKNRDFSDSSFRENFLFFSLVIVLVAISIRVFYLQAIRGEYYRYLSERNRIKTVTIHAPRGIIFDRNNIPLVYNVPGFRKTTDGKTELLGKEKALELIAKGEKGLEIDVLREYPYNQAMAHVLGFIGQISKEELTSPKFLDYKMGDLIGKEGIEKEYEQELKGVNGKQLLEVNSVGEEIRKLGQTDPNPGQNIKLTIDEKLQTAAFEALKDVKRGAVVVSTPKGEILAIVSKPSFDPNLFTMGESYKKSSESASLSEILNDSTNQPMLNRAISGVYPPGSTFKLVVAASGLEDKIIDENYQVEDTGVLRVGTFSFSNWFYTGYGRTDGSLNIVGAIKRSNDIFFYKLAEKIGVDTISKWAKKFELGKPLGINLPGEVGGTVPSLEWKKEAIGEQWYLGDTYNFGIGQGYLLTTPLQVNNWTQVVANGGTLYKPQMLLGQKPEVRSSKLLNEKTVDLIHEGMIGSCSPGGVAWPFFDFKVKNGALKIDGKNLLEVPISSGSADMRQVVVACKTGTAEHGGKTTLPHAWITLFAPAYNPQIVVTVLVEESGEGSNIAAPIAKKILESYFGKN
jgi:penicillin-binding protein 2